MTGTDTRVAWPVPQLLKLITIEGYIHFFSPRVNGGQVLLHFPTVLVRVNNAPLWTLVSSTQELVDFPAECQHVNY